MTRRPLAVIASVLTLTVLAACGTDPAADIDTPAGGDGASTQAPADATREKQDQPDQADQSEQDEEEYNDEEPVKVTLGPVAVTNADGHTATFRTDFPTWQFIADTSEGETGEAGIDMVWDTYGDPYRLVIENTGSEPYTAPLYGGLFSYYDVDSAACDAPNRGVTGPYMMATDEYCIYHLMVLEPNEGEIEPGGIILMEQASGWTQRADLAGHPEAIYPSDDAQEIATSLSRPAGYLVRFADTDITGSDCDNFTPPAELDPRYWGDEAPGPFAAFGPICS